MQEEKDVLYSPAVCWLVFQVKFEAAFGQIFTICGRVRASVSVKLIPFVTLAKLASHELKVVIGDPGDHPIRLDLCFEKLRVAGSSGPFSCIFGCPEGTLTTSFTGTASGSSEPKDIFLNTRRSG
jgi:hypothetical protein